MTHRLVRAWLAVMLCSSLPGLTVTAMGQTIASLRATVADSQGGVLPGTDVTLAQPLSGLERRATTAGDGHATFDNIAPGRYVLRVELTGFEPEVREIDLSSGVPLQITVTLGLAAQSTSVTVTATNGALVDPSATGTRNLISQVRIAQLPSPVGSRGIEAVLATFPGFAQNANGAIHPRGAHNQMTFVIDGLAISDQLTGAFANALDSAIVENAELMTGNIPAEFGSKVSGVAVVTSRSGLGVARPLAGDVTGTAAGFATRHGVLQAGGGGSRIGYFGSATAMGTDRFLDQVSRENLHNQGAFARGFARLDLIAGTHDTLRLHAMGGRSRFELANLRSQQAAGQDQRQRLGDRAVWGSHLRSFGARATLDTTVGVRTTHAALLPSAGDRPITAAQQRSLASTSIAVRGTRVFGAHSIRAAADYQRFPVHEHFTMGLTAPAFNAPDSPAFNAALLAHDLTRGGAPFTFDDTRAGRLWSASLQPTVHIGPTTLALGLRYDDYRFLVRGIQWQPRLGFAWELPGRTGVVRASYNRNYQTPPNENLLLSGSAAAARLAPPSVGAALGGAYRPIRPERQDVVEVGFQRAFGSRASLDVSAYHKRSRDQQDNNNFFDTGIIFPTTLASIVVDGAEARLTVPAHRGWSGSVSATTGRAISTPPFTGGLFLGQSAVDLLSMGPFAIDHDQRLSTHTTIQFDPASCLWFGGSVRYDSGLVSNPSSPAVVAADPDFADLLPYVDLGTRIPRVRPRTITDVAAGCDLRASGRRTWNVQIQVTNLTNRTALYNFQSVFVGTRLVQPRTLALRVGRSF